MKLALLGLIFASSMQQSSTLPPEGAVVVAMVQGRGVQIYRCTSSAWAFQAPEALLYDTAGKYVGKHGAGPSWTWTDGSAVQGKVLAKTPSPDPVSVPWLLLEAHTTGSTGVLSPVTLVRRSETEGGNAPAAGCNATNEGAFLRVQYKATYTFYKPAP